MFKRCSLNRWIKRGLFFFFFIPACSPSLIYELNENTALHKPFQKIPENLESISAKSCGKCHAEIYEEWRTSMHSKSFTDPLFLAYWEKDKFTWSCLVCHTPLENQLKKKITHFKKNNFSKPVFEKNEYFNQTLQQEGITCVVCHLKDGVIYGPYKKEALSAPHPVAFDATFFTEDICLKCHQVQAKRFSWLKSNICSTGDEWEKGPYKQSNYICQNCHMPEAFRPLMEGLPKKAGRHHLFKGGNAPKQVEKALTVETAHQLGSDGTRTGKIKVSITNSGAGHFFPTGDPDRKVFITAELVNRTGTIISNKTISFGRTILWKPIMIEFSDSRLAPMETRTIILSFPEKLDSEKIILRITGIYQILTERSKEKLVKNYNLRDIIPSRYTFLDRVIPVSALDNF